MYDFEMWVNCFSYEAQISRNSALKIRLFLSQLNLINIFKVIEEGVFKIYSLRVQASDVLIISFTVFHYLRRLRDFNHHLIFNHEFIMQENYGNESSCPRHFEIWL